MFYSYKQMIENYSNPSQIAYYTKRVEKGLSETEAILIGKYLADKNLRVLDVGTGCGRVSIAMAKLGYSNLTGIDINPIFITTARNYAFNMNLNIRFGEMYIEDTPFKRNGIDGIIFSSDGFSQVIGEENRMLALASMRKIIKKEGTIIIAVIDYELVKKNKPQYLEYIDNFKSSSTWKECGFYDQNDIKIYDGGYIHLIDRAEMERLANKVKLKIVEITAPEESLGRTDNNSSNISRFYILKKYYC